MEMLIYRLHVGSIPNLEFRYFHTRLLIFPTNGIKGDQINGQKIIKKGLEEMKEREVRM
jgi:hypothetical protein